MILVGFRLLLKSLRIFLKLVDGTLLQSIRAFVLRLVGPLFIITFALLLFVVVIDILSPMNHVLRLPEPPATRIDSISAQLPDAKHPPSRLSADSPGREALPDGLRLQRLENALYELSFHHDCTRGEIKGLDAQAKRQSLRTDQELASHAAALSGLIDLRKDLEALELLVRAHTFQGGTSSELERLRRDFDALQLLAAEVVSHVPKSAASIGM